jgi:AraC-like DNA-binding protein
MLEACLAPSAATRQRAEKSINATLRERVRKAVARHLRSPSLSADTLCREAATSRSQLYRLLEDEGGVARYIQRRRLSESFAMLGDSANTVSIGRIAELLCFADASSFARAFRREFGVSPNDDRAASRSGLPAGLLPGRDEGAVNGFRDCLRSA